MTETEAPQIIEGQVIVHDAKQMLPVPTHDAPIVMPAVAIEEAVKAYAAYQQLDQRILNDADYTFYVQYKQGQYDKEATLRDPDDAEAFAQQVGGKVVKRKKKSAFRKLGNFFGLTMPEQEEILGSEIITLEDGYVLKEWGKGWQGFCFMNRAFHVFRQQYTGVVIHKNSGTTYIGVGACSVDERKSGRQGWKQRDHAILGTAWTRMLSRGISDVIGLGEVSVEEIQSLEEIESEYTPPPEANVKRQTKHADPAPSTKPTTIIPEGGFPHWGKLFGWVWDQHSYDRTQIFDLFPGKTQDDLLMEYGTLEKAYHAICDRIAIAKAGGELEPTTTNAEEGIPPARPFDAPNLHIWLMSKAGLFDPTWTLTDGQRGRVLGVLDKMAKSTDNRHTFLKAVWGQESGDDRNDAEMWAMWKHWINCTKDPETGEYIPDDMAVTEVRMIVEKAIAEERPRSAQEDIQELFG